MTKFIQIAAMPADIGSHPCGIFALDEAGTVWRYEGQYGWVAFTDKRSREKEDTQGRVTYEEITPRDATQG